MAAHRLKKYREQINVDNQYAPGVNSFVDISNRKIRTQKSAPQHVVQGPTFFNPMQIDGPTDLDALPKLKPSTIIYEVFVTSMQDISVTDKAKEEERLREEKQVEEAKIREGEKKLEEEKLNEQEELKKQFEAKVENDLDATLPIPEQKELIEDIDTKNLSISEEDKNWHEVVLASPDMAKFPEQAIKEFLHVLLNPLTPESTKKELLMKYSFSHYIGHYQRMFRDQNAQQKETRVVLLKDSIHIIDSQQAMIIALFWLHRK